MIQFHIAPGGPHPVAPFSYAVETDGRVFVTGQTPDTPEAPRDLPDRIETQTRNVIADFTTPLNGIRMGLQYVTMVRSYPTHFEDDCKRYFPECHRPVHICVGTTGLAYDARVEIDLIARRPTS